MLCTGLREAEVTGLDVDDLRRTSDGVLGVHVRDGKGAKSRFVPYGSGVWCLSYLDAWLNNAGIQTGAVFRGFTDRWLPGDVPGEQAADAIRERLTERMTPRTVQRVLKKYPVMIQGQLQTVKPHDLRHTYAKRSYDSGVELTAIRDNLGHADVRTTQGYIGAADMSARAKADILAPQHDMQERQRLAQPSQPRARLQRGSGCS